MNLTDIIKDLEELHQRLVLNYNDGVPFEQFEEDRLTMSNALDLINRQKAEIEECKFTIKALEQALSNVTIEADRLLKESNSKENAYNEEFFLRKEKETEIERLEQENVKLHTIIPKMIVEAKAKAIKEFWGKIKKYCKREVCFFTPQDERELIRYGNNLVKETVGE